MNKKQADRELDYRIGEIVLATMLAQGIITQKEYEDARRYLIVKLKPLIGSLGASDEA
jgi:membrane peptidoglycan carboxypeptidase